MADGTKIQKSSIQTLGIAFGLGGAQQVNEPIQPKKTADASDSGNVNKGKFPQGPAIFQYKPQNLGTYA